MISILRSTPLHFVCNSAAQSTVVTPYAGTAYFEEASTGFVYMQAGDNINLLSVAIATPGFVQLLTPSNQCSIPLAIVFDVVGPDPWFSNYVPFNPYEVAVGNFIDLSTVLVPFRVHPTFAGGLPLALTGLIPSSMDGLDVGISVVVKIEHNLPLTAAPPP